MFLRYKHLMTSIIYPAFETVSSVVSVRNEIDMINDFVILAVQQSEGKRTQSIRCNFEFLFFGMFSSNDMAIRLIC